MSASPPCAQCGQVIPAEVAEYSNTGDLLCPGCLAAYKVAESRGRLVKEGLVRARPVDPIWGVRITSRGKTDVDVAVFGPLILLGALFGALFLAVGDFALRLIGGLAIVVCVLAARWLFLEVDFYERAAVRRLFRRRHVFRYDQVKSVDFELIDQYAFFFVHAGMKFRIQLNMLDGRRLRFSDHYRPGFVELELSGKKFESREAIDLVRIVIEANIARRLEQSSVSDQCVDVQLD